MYCYTIFVAFAYVVSIAAASGVGRTSHAVILSAPPVPVTLSVNVSDTFTVAPELVSVALSVYAPGVSPSDPWTDADVLTMRLDDPDFAFLSRALTDVGASAPARTLLRIGGSYNDAVYYETPEDFCPPGSIHGPLSAGTPPPASPAFCLTRARWAQIAAYAAAARIDIVFGVNFVVGRNTSGTPGKSDGPMDLTNLEHWLTMNRGLAYPAFRAIELGNELSDSVPVDVYAADVLRTRALVDRVYAGVPRAERPLLVGPADNFWDLSYIASLLSNASVVDALDVFSMHHYGPSGIDPVTETDAWEPSFLVKAALDAASVRSATPLWAASGKPTWVSETALAWHSGRNGTSNTFSDGPWYLTQLAGMAWHGVAAQARQTLRGGFYQLISNWSSTPMPNPDWWTARVFKRAMGTTFLRTSSSAPCCAVGTVFAYAACAPGGGLSIAYVNTARNATYSVSMELTAASALADSEPLPITPRDEYVLTTGEPGTLNATTMRLNGVLLTYGGGELTPIDPRTVTDASPFLLPPLSYGFVTLPAASLAACA